MEELAKVITGDWEAIAKCASTFNSLSFFCEDVAYDLRINLGALLETWHGNAANGAFQYFGAFGTTIPALAEMARELLAGRISPREVMTSSSYASALEPGVARFRQWYGSLSDKQRAEQEELGRAALERLADEPETPPVRARRQNPAEGHENEDFSDRSWLT